MSSVEEIENRMNQTKNILHKCSLEGQINIGLMISDIDYLLNEIKNLVDENEHLHEEINKRIKLKIENEKIVDNEFISKNKIREKIEEYEELVKDFEEYWSKDPRKFKKEKSVDYYKIEALQELLNDNHIPHID